MVLEDMSFENVDGRTSGRATNACLYFKLTCGPSAEVS